MSEQLNKRVNLVKASKLELAVPEQISKYNVGVVTMWFGKRDLANDDLDTFNNEIHLGKQFAHLAAFEIPEANHLQDEPYPAFAGVDLDLRKELGTIKEPLVIFIVTTANIVDRPWLINFPQGLHYLRIQQGRDKTTFIYKIILGAGFSQQGSEDPQGHFSKNEMRAHELGGVYIPYTHNYRSLGIRRAVEFMNRILGYDLPGEKFPNYTAEETQKIAWSISREDFNAYSPRESAITKYPIVGGKPQFSF